MRDTEMAAAIVAKLEELKTLDPVAVETFNFRKHEWDQRRRLKMLDAYLSNAKARIEGLPECGTDGEPFSLVQTTAFREYAQSNSLSPEAQRRILKQANERKA